MNGVVIDDGVLVRALKFWGVESQMDMVIEECLELALALQKLKRKRGDVEQKVLNVIDEIADVKIMLRQAEIVFGEEAVNKRVEFKISRLEGRIEEGLS